MELTQDGFLDGRVMAWQPRTGYRAATDPVLLGAAVPARPQDHVLELGCGAGVAALCLAARVGELRITGIEIQNSYAALARRNALENGAPLDVIDADLSNLPAPLRDQSFDHVMANPPYFQAGSTPEDTGRSHSRHEGTPLADWIDVAARRLKPKGWLTIILPIERLPELLSLAAPRFGDLTVKPLSPRDGRAPSRFLFKARKGSKGAFRLCPPLILHQGRQHIADGDDYTEIARQILRGGQVLDWD